MIRKSIAPCLIAVDRFVDAAESGDHDAENSGIAFGCRRENVHAVRVRKPEVDHQRVEREGVEAAHGFGRRRHEHGLEARCLQ